jgi:hypothetical protein
MLASRACRSSIMIGRALDAPVQRRILSRLADLDAPWNCPHGRPTMRHLAVLPAVAPGLALTEERAAPAGGEDETTDEEQEGEEEEEEGTE